MQYVVHAYKKYMVDDVLLLIIQVTHPIHDQTFYLTLEHKRKLKEEYGRLMDSQSIFERYLCLVLS